jgi:hypothetical protein
MQSFKRNAYILLAISGLAIFAPDLGYHTTTRALSASTEEEKAVDSDPNSVVPIPPANYLRAIRKLQQIDIAACDGFAVVAGSTTTCPAAILPDQCTIYGGEMATGTGATGPFLVDDTTPSSNTKLACLADAVAVLAPARTGIAMPADIGGLTFTAGTHVHPSAVLIPLTANEVYVDAEGDPDAVFIFKAGSTLLTCAGCKIVLINSAKPENVFWIIGTALTMGDDSILVGTVLAGSAVTIGLNSMICGDVIAQTAITCSGVCDIGFGDSVCTTVMAPPTPVPTPVPTPLPTPLPTPSPTDSPITPSPTNAPIPAATPAPTFAGGVNGDPLIIGLSGQLFFFDGRSGGWYSAISTPSFQWNMELQTYKNCPYHADNFVSGVGFTFYNRKGKAQKKVKVNVVNPQRGVNIGCGKGSANCLGSGSLEVIIDGVKHVTGGDYKFKDGGGRIVAFNTFYQCSRKWYDFDVRPPTLEEEGTGLLAGRRLNNDERNVFDVITGLKPTMIDEHVCQKWMTDREERDDLFDQAGHWSTVIIETKDITLHLEYKQQNELCESHSIDVWVSSVSASLLEEEWEGIIGETKDASYDGNNRSVMAKPKSRAKVLKYAKDHDYEVVSPFATKCKGCTKKR